MDLAIVEGLRHLYVPRLNIVSTYSQHGFRYWLSSSDDFVVSSNSSDDDYSISYYDYDGMLTYWAGDINRLACASLETISNCNESTVNKKFVAWNLIQYYYAAFYSAHSILKTLGFGLVSVDNSIRDRIMRKERIAGNAVSFESGIYCVFFEPRNGVIHFKKVKKYDDSHRGLWARFIDLIDILTATAILDSSSGAPLVVPNPTGTKTSESVFSQLSLQDAVQIVERLDLLKSKLAHNGNSNWLSMTRNLLNYNHAYGAWYPYEGSQNCERINALQEACKNPPLSPFFSDCAEPEIVAYTKVCQLVNSINFEIMQDLFYRHPENKSFLRNGIYAFNRLHPLGLLA